MSRRDPAWLAEALPQRRFGLKGPRAAAALAQAGLVSPERPNCWAPLRAGEEGESWNVVARLGASEFFIEERGDAPGIAALDALITHGFAGAYPVLREDTAIVLGGPEAAEVLAQVCNVNLPALPLTARPIVMTLMIGVGVLVLPQYAPEDGHIYRIWCDPSFGSYLWSELDEIVTRIPTGRAQ